MNETESKKFYIKTFGCQANIADSHSITGVLESLNFENIKNPTGINEDEILRAVLLTADVLIINTCSVRQKSEDKVYGIGRLIKLAKKNNRKIPFVIMAGCMVGSVSGTRARDDFNSLRKKTPWVNEYINPAQIMHIPFLLQKNGLLSKWALSKFDPANIIISNENPSHAFVNISYGCDNFCTFCVVPYARGAERSRSKEEIIKEVKHYVSRGMKEVTLCGQNVNSWGIDAKEKFNIRAGSNQILPLAGLLREIHNIEGLNKISFISSNPFDFTSNLIKTIALPKISNYIHIAVQSGNNEILKRMNRRHTVEDYLALINEIKKSKPKVELGTDIIVGFPGETREQFMDTVKLFKKIKFNVAYISMYSSRKGTSAERFFVDDVPIKEKKWRHSYLTKVWEDTKLNE